MTDATPTPLKVIAVNPPTLESADEDGRYTVTLRLSREVTAAEYEAVPAIARGMRVYRSTLEIYRTTLESVAGAKEDISTILASAEERGRRQDEHAAHVARKQAEAQQLVRDEEERLRKLAGSITFD